MMSLSPVITSSLVSLTYYGDIQPAALRLGAYTVPLADAVEGAGAYADALPETLFVLAADADLGSVSRLDLRPRLEAVLLELSECVKH